MRSACIVITIDSSEEEDNQDSMGNVTGGQQQGEKNSKDNVMGEKGNDAEDLFDVRDAEHGGHSGY